MPLWPRARRAERAEEIKSQLAELEERAARASAGYVAQHLLQAGDLCVRNGHPGQALLYYGRVLDLYLESGRLAAAETLCGRMVEVAPEAVRVRGTRMWLIAARGSMDEIRAAVAEYARTGAAAAQEDLVAHQLCLLAEASPVEVREIAAEALLDLGADEAADRWFGSVYAERNGISPPSTWLADHEWGERMLEAALLRPEQARERSTSTAA